MNVASITRITLFGAIALIVFALPIAVSAQPDTQKHDGPDHPPIEEPPQKPDLIAGPVVCMALQCPDSGEPIWFPVPSEQRGDHPDLENTPSDVADPPPEDPDDISDKPRF